MRDANRSTRWLRIGILVCAIPLLGESCTSKRYRDRGSKKERSDSYKKVAPKTAEEWDLVLDDDQRPIFPDRPKLQALSHKVEAKAAPIESPCIEGGKDVCYRGSLDRFFVKLDNLVESQDESVRILQLGDSHIAADYITRTSRSRLQKEFGSGGRGFVHVEQRAKYGGRKKDRDGNWRRARMVDHGQAGQPFGFSGMAIESSRLGDSIQFVVRDDDYVEIFYYAHPKGAKATVSISGQILGRIDTGSRRKRTKSERFRIPERRDNNRTDGRTLEIVAGGPGVRLFGLSFTQKESGVIYDSVGPVGADALTYLSMDHDSFEQAIDELDPDLVIIMLGGNDALRVRQERASIADTRKYFRELVDLIKESAPKSDCMLWAPMDAGERQGKDIVQKSYIEEIRSVQHEVALEKGCAFWDTYAAMGGRGSIQRWYEAGIINKDLIHPRFKAGLLLGHLFATALMKKYDEG